MRLHGNHAFHGFPWVVSTGGLLAAFGPTLGTRHRDPETGQLRIECQGFNGPVQQAFRKHRFFDKEGLFIGDGSYLFVPDNDKYEGSTRMLFDESNHPISTKERLCTS